MKILTSKSDNMRNPVLGVRKEDDMYYQGPFWIIGDSFLDILLFDKLIGLVFLNFNQNKRRRRIN